MGSFWPSWCAGCRQRLHWSGRCLLPVVVLSGEWRWAPGRQCWPSVWSQWQSLELDLVGSEGSAIFGWLCSRAVPSPLVVGVGGCSVRLGWVGLPGNGQQGRGVHQELCPARGEAPDHRVSLPSCATVALPLLRVPSLSLASIVSPLGCRPRPLQTSECNT